MAAGIPQSTLALPYWLQVLIKIVSYQTKEFELFNRTNSFCLEQPMKKNSKLIKSSVGLFGVLVLILTGYATQAQKPNPAHNSILPANEEKLRVLFSSNPAKLLECLSPIKTWGDKLPENTTLLVGLDQSGNRYCQIVHKDDTGKYLNECRRALAQNSQCMTVMTNQAVYYDRLDALFSLLSSSSDTVILPFLMGIGSRVHAAIANRCFGVNPPKAMFGRS